MDALMIRMSPTTRPRPLLECYLALQAGCSVRVPYEPITSAPVDNWNAAWDRHANRHLAESAAQLRKLTDDLSPKEIAAKFAACSEIFPESVKSVKVSNGDDDDNRNLHQVAYAMRDWYRQQWPEHGGIQDNDPPINEIIAMKSSAPAVALPAGLAAPDSYVLVPRKYTPEMRAAWDSSPQSEDDDSDFSGAWSAMLAAAPVPQVQPSEIRNAALEEAAAMLLGGSFLHEQAPTARLAREAAQAILKMKSVGQQADKPAEGM